VPVFKDLYDPNTPELSVRRGAGQQAARRAGIRQGRDGIREKTGETLSYRIVVQAGPWPTTSASSDHRPAQGHRLARPTTRPGGYRRPLQGRLRPDLWPLVSPRPTTVYSVFYGTRGAQRQAINPKLDEVFAKLENTSTRRSAGPCRRDAEDHREDLPSIPLTTNVALIAKTAKLKGLVPIRPT